MKAKRPRFVYTNIGLESQQHRLLRHLAVEERRDMASLVREAIDAYIGEKRSRGAIPHEEDFVLTTLGRKWVAEEERPYDPRRWSKTDQDLYGPGPRRK